MANTRSTLPTPETSFTPYESKPHLSGTGVRHRYRFDNGYGASVVRFAVDLPAEYGYDGPPMGSYGVADGLWELAVIIHDGNRSGIVYDTPITNDVLGYLTDADVDETLHRIAALPPRP